LDALGTALGREQAGPALGWLELIELDWILAGSQLAGNDRAGLDLGWLDAIEPGLAGDG
jgi:hypothetical protein